MSKRNTESVQELSLDALETVMGGSAAPMGLGGSIMPPSAHPQAQAAGHGIPGLHGVGYTDHFGLHLGHGTAAHGTAAGATAAAGPAAATANAGSVSSSTSAPSPMGLGGSTGHGAVNATSAFQLVEQAAPQDAQAQDAQGQDAGAAMPEGLGGDSQ